MVTDAAAWDARYSEPGLTWGAEPNRRLVAEVEGLPAGRALDLGAGEGRNAAWLASRGWQVTAVDFSAVGIRRAVEMGAECGGEVFGVVADLRDYEPERSAFDLVVLLYLQVPADLLSRVLRRASEAVAPGGTLLLIAHDLENLKRGHGGPQDRAVLQSAEQVVEALDDSLEVQKAGQIDRLVDTPQGQRTAIDTLVRATRSTS